MTRISKPPQRITQEQIAERLGLSQFTVSHALRGTDKVAPETRDMILAAAQKLGYRVNAAARATATGRTGSIALLRPSDHQAWWFPIDLFHGIENGVDKHHLRLLSARVTTARLDDERFIPRILQELVADGVIVHCPVNTPPHLSDLLKRYRIPAIWVNTLDSHDAIRPDDDAMTTQVVEHLLQLGHQRFAYVRGFYANHWSCQSRERVVCARIAAAQLPPTTIITRDRDTAARGTHAIAELAELLRQPNRPTALIGYSPAEIQLMTTAAAQAGLQIPADISIAVTASTNDQIFLDALATTAGEITWMTLGERAVDLLMDKIKNPDLALPAVIMPPSFHAGQTTAPPPTNHG
jgi:DNA-binding LacI/PurR family transcriptional regulator